MGATASGTVVGAVSSIIAGIASPQAGIASGVTLAVSVSLLSGIAVGAVPPIARRRPMSRPPLFTREHPAIRDPFVPAAPWRVPRPKR